MGLNLALLLFAITTVIRAQASSSSVSATSSAASSTTSPPFTHTVSVAYAGFTFSPDVTLANIGDIIQFDFYPVNHSVVRAEWLYPCIPYEDTGVDKVGFFSGFEPVDAILQDPPTFSIRVNDTNPIFYYCSAPGSCINHGMVGVINPNATTPIETQIAFAKNSTFMLEPGQPWPSEEDNPFSTQTPTPTPTTSLPPVMTTHASTTTPVATATVTAAPSSSHSLSGGAIAGIVIGATAVLLLAAALLYMCGRNSHRQYHPAPPGSVHGAPMFVTHPHMSYIGSPNKHLSTVTSHTGHTRGSFVSPALPGYIAQHDPAMSPPLQGTFPINNDHITPAGGAGSESHAPSSPTTSNNGTFPMSGPAPAYHIAHPTMIPVYQIPPQGVYEMETPVTGNDSNGILGFIKKSGSTKKGTVERYG